MAFSSLKLMGPIPPMAESSPIKRRTELIVSETTRALQVRCEGIQEQHQPPPKALKNTSRRDIMLYMSAMSLAATTLLSAAPAEARIKNPEIRRKIMEKLEILREKAGLSKSKTKDGADKEKSPIETPPPNLQNSPIGPLVEATISRNDRQ